MAMRYRASLVFDILSFCQLLPESLHTFHSILDLLRRSSFLSRCLSANYITMYSPKRYSSN